MRKSYMSGTEYRKALQAIGLPSHRTAAKFLHVDMATNKRRAYDQGSVSWDTATLLRLMVNLKLKPEHLVNILGSD